jgi:ADP-ribose pyrophosphatase
MSGKDDGPVDLSASDVELISRETLFERYSRLHVLHLRHRLFRGGWSREVEREVFERKNAAAVLPYDPVRDEVVLVEQFRPGAYAARLDCFQLEPVAGAIEPGQDPLEVARREAQEEAGCEILAFEPIGTYTVSPGYSTEIVFAWCGRVDVRGVGGVHGQAHEDEDIRVHVLPFDAAMRRLAAGEFQYALTIIALQWLALSRDRLRTLWR